MLLHLERYGLREEGILRISGLEQKVAALCSELEVIFYSRPLEEVDKLLQQATCHELSAALKRLLRNLPQPLLTIEYIDMFYQTHGKCFLACKCIIWGGKEKFVVVPLSLSSNEMTCQEVSHV